MRSHGDDHGHDHELRPRAPRRRQGRLREAARRPSARSDRPSAADPSAADAAGRGGGRGRARRGDVRASILALLKDRPMHGYEMIQEIGERSGGAWKPSPGSVYPTLQLLEDEGLITSASEGGKKLFTLTDPGRSRGRVRPRGPLGGGRARCRLGGVNEIRQAGFGLMEAFGQVWKTGSADQRQKALTVINDARKKLYLILADED